MSLQGSSVLVTGGTRGIGLAIALRLVRDGAARVVLGYMRNDAAAAAAAEQVRAAGAEPVLVRGNVSSARVVAELAAAGPYRVVVHNAATGVARPALETDDKHWDWTMNANARALLALARAAAPAMEAGSSIVAISSLGSQRVLDNYVLIGTSKAALESVVRYLAVELAPRGHPCERGLGRRRRDRRARALPEQGRDAPLGRAHARGAARRAGRRRRRGLLPLLRRRGDGARPHADRRRRLLPARVMEPTEHNRRAWDEVHRRRAEARPDRRGLPPIVRKTLGDLAKKRVLHLQCATGEASAELAELGAVVTGVDFSEEALDVARERWPKILWIEADVQSLPAKLRRGRFDLVYSAEGVLAGLDDLDAWAHGIVDALHPLGELLVFEEHPVAECVDGLLRWHRDYFGDAPGRSGSGGSGRW